MKNWKEIKIESWLLRCLSGNLWRKLCSLCFLAFQLVLGTTDLDAGPMLCWVNRARWVHFLSRMALLQKLSINIIYWFSRISGDSYRRRLRSQLLCPWLHVRRLSGAFHSFRMLLHGCLSKEALLQLQLYTVNYKYSALSNAIVSPSSSSSSSSLSSSSSSSISLSNADISPSSLLSSSS